MTTVDAWEGFRRLNPPTFPSFLVFRERGVEKCPFSNGITSDIGNDVVHDALYYYILCLLAYSNIHGPPPAKGFFVERALKNRIDSVPTMLCVVSVCVSACVWLSTGLYSSYSRPVTLIFRMGCTQNDSGKSKN